MEAAMQLPATVDDGEWLEPVELEEGPLAPDEVLLAVASCAVCRTDLQIVKGDLPARMRPVIPGHQAIGRVVDVGRGVTNWSVGQRGGTIWLGWACGRCRYCRSGRENLCIRARFTGWDRHGGFAPRVRVHKDFLLPLPDSIDDVDGAPLLCAGVIGYRALRLAGVQPGTRLRLYGFGASAHLALEVARHMGAIVHVGVRHAAGVAEAMEHGANSAGPYDQAPPRPLDAAIIFPRRDRWVSTRSAHSPPVGGSS
jgi:propanol-preferring alcohol dehydrogenase